jgi:hypothetical protein
MLRTLEKLLASPSPEHTYLAERLDSAKWLGWDPSPANGISSGKASPAPKRSHRGVSAWRGRATSE